MARTFNLTDGTTTVSLLALTDPGITAQRGGLGPNTLKRDNVVTTGEMGQAWVSYFTDQPVVERYRLNLRATSHDNMASQIQAFYKLLDKAPKYFDPRFKWQNSPVYLTAQMTNETGARYAAIYAWESLTLPDQYTTPAEVDNDLEGIEVILIRSFHWHDTPPGTLPSAATMRSPDLASITDTIAMVNNAIESTQPSHVFYYDASGTSFSSNLVDDPAAYLMPATPAVGDILYIGSDGQPFHNVILNLAAWFSYQSGPSYGTNYRWEFWNGSSWAVISSDFSDPSNSLLASDRWGRPENRYNVHLNSPSNWATTAINGVTAYWIRFNILSGSAPTGRPQVQELIRSLTMPFFDIAKDQISGDSPALVDFRLWSQSSIFMGPHRVTIASKSTNLDHFQSHINLGDSAIPSFWTVTAGTDTSVTDLVQGPDGKGALCTFTTSQALATRLTVAISNSQAADGYRGKFRVRLRCRQVNTGEVSVRLSMSMNTSIGNTVITDTKTLKAASGSNNRPEVLDFGEVSIPVSDDRDLGKITYLGISIQAQADSATPDLELYDLQFIPLDESVVTVQDPFTPGIGLSTDSDTQFYGFASELKMMDVDSGLLKGIPAAILWAGRIDDVDDDTVMGTLSEFDATSGTDITVDTTSQIDGEGSLEIDITDTSARTADLTDPSAEVKISAGLKIKLDDLVMTSGDQFQFFSGQDGASPHPFTATIRDDSGTKKLEVSAGEDGGGTQTTTAVNITGTVKIQINWKASDSAGLDNGWLELWVDDELQELITGLDNDTINCETIRTETTNLDAGTSGQMRADSIWWAKGVGRAPEQYVGLESRLAPLTRWEYNGRPFTLEPGRNHRIFFFLDYFTPSDVSQAPLFSQPGLPVSVQTYIVDRWATLRGAD